MKKYKIGDQRPARGDDVGECPLCGRMIGPRDGLILTDRTVLPAWVHWGCHFYPPEKKVYERD